MRDVLAEAGAEPYVVRGRLTQMGSDWVALLWGGQAHVGAVAIAQPRPSGRDPRTRSATSSVYTLLGHAEDIIAKRVSERLAAALDRPVVVIAGMHWDNLDEDGIAIVAANCQRWAEAVLAAL